MKTFTLPQILTEAQINEAIRLYEAERGEFSAMRQIRTHVIEPNMPEINRKLGQENDATYLAYAVVYALSQAATKGAS